MTLTPGELERVALPVLNEIHDEECEMIARIAEVCESGDEEPLEDLMGELYEHFKAHFDLEEQNMLRTEFEDYDEHRAEHEAMRVRYQGLMEDGSLDELTDFFTEELPDWFRDHVANLDVVTAEHVAAWGG